MTTYCEKISDNEWALHATPEEMAFVLDLVNSIEHPTATKLRSRLEPEIRSHNGFQLLIENKIEICEKCKGEGTMNIGDRTGSHNHDKTDCYRCHGEGRRVVVITKRYKKLDRQLVEGEG